MFSPPFFAECCFLLAFIGLLQRYFDHIETSIQIKVISMLQNRNLLNSSHYRIFKCTCFVFNHYVSAINLDVLCHPLMFLANLILCLNRVYGYFESIKFIFKKNVFQI